MTRPPPHVRARATQELLACMDEFRPGLEAKVRARVDPEVMARIDGAVPTSWVPVSDTRHVVQTAVEILGEDEAPNLWRYFFANHFVRSPLLRTFIEGVLRMIGASPAAMMRKAIKAWPATYRDVAVADVEVEDDADHGAIILRDIHPDMFQYPGYFVALQGAFAGFLDVTRHEGTCTKTVDPGAAMARFELRW